MNNNADHLIMSLFAVVRMGTNITVIGRSRTKEEIDVGDICRRMGGGIFLISVLKG